MQRMFSSALLIILLTASSAVGLPACWDELPQSAKDSYATLYVEYMELIERKYGNSEFLTTIEKRAGRKLDYRFERIFDGFDANDDGKTRAILLQLDARYSQADWAKFKSKDIALAFTEAYREGMKRKATAKKKGDAIRESYLGDRVGSVEDRGAYDTLLVDFNDLYTSSKTVSAARVELNEWLRSRGIAGKAKEYLFDHMKSRGEEKMYEDFGFMTGGDESLDEFKKRLGFGNGRPTPALNPILIGRPPGNVRLP